MTLKEDFSHGAREALTGSLRMGHYLKLSLILNKARGQNEGHQGQHFRYLVETLDPWKAYCSRKNVLWRSIFIQKAANSIISGKLLSPSDSRCYLKTETKISTRQGCLENYTRYHSTSHRHLLILLDYGLSACLNPVHRRNLWNFVTQPLTIEKP